MTSCIFVNKMVYDLYKVREKNANKKKNYPENIRNNYKEKSEVQNKTQISFDYIVKKNLLHLATNPFI